MLFPSVQYPIFLSVFIVYIVLMVILFAIDFILIRTNLKLELKRHLDIRLSLLDDNPVNLEISHRGAIPLSIKVMESGLDKFVFRPAVLETDLVPHSRCVLKYNIVPIMRGDFSFEALHVRARSKMNFVIVQKHFPLKGNIKVLPNIRAISKYNILTRHPLGTPGERVVRRTGGGTSFKELRDYVPGDEYRQIDWKSTARRSKLTVKEYEDERCQNLMILIDTGRHMTSFVPHGAKEGLMLLGTDLYSEDTPPWENPFRETTRLDFTVNASLMLSYVALSKGDYVGVMAFSDKQELFLPPRSGKGQIIRIVNSLYGLKPKLRESDYRRAFMELSSLQRKRSLVIFFTDLIDPDSSKNLIKYIQSLYPRHTVLVVAFRDAEIAAQAEKIPVDSAELYDIAVAKDLLYNRELALHELQKKGAMTLDLYPEELTMRVVSEYLRLKSRVMR